MRIHLARLLGPALFTLAAHAGAGAIFIWTGAEGHVHFSDPVPVPRGVSRRCSATRLTQAGLHPADFHGTPPLAQSPARAFLPRDAAHGEAGPPLRGAQPQNF